MSSILFLFSGISLGLGLAAVGSIALPNGLPRARPFDAYMFLGVAFAFLVAALIP